MLNSGFFIQIAKKWGLNAPQQLYRMMKLHRTPFTTIMHNLYEALEAVEGHFAFPTIANIAKMRPQLVKEIVREGHEVASHGLNHVRYTTLNYRERHNDLQSSLRVFKEIGIDITGFRAPYDQYTDDMPFILERTGLVWDGGFGYRAEHREKTKFFHQLIDGRESKVTYIPLNAWSDDYMIDRLRMGPNLVSKVLKREVAKAAPSEGVIMFDLHPIRMGQREYVGCIRDIIEYAHGLGGWCATPTEAVKYWETHRKWEGDSKFCLLLTGDIDNWVFSDYLRRVLWRRRIG